MSEKRNPKKGNKGKAAAPAGKAASPANSPIDVGLLAQIVELMSANDLNTVDVRNGDRRVILKRGAVAGPVQVVQAPVAPVPAVNPGAVAAASAGPPQTRAPAAEDESTFLRVKSPMVGTFYAAPKPGEKPFVSVGSVVAEDTDVCIVEAMKTFNNIKAECRGTIARVLAQDGQPVEFGTTLFLVKPS